MKSPVKNNQKTCKFPADIAREWGCRVYEKGGLQKKQLEPVIAALSREDFPKKERNAYKLPAIIEFGRQFVTLSKDRRKITIKESDHQGTKTQSEELPPQNSPADGELFKAEPNIEKSLDLWQDKLVNPERWVLDPIASWQITKLERYRPWLLKKTEKESSDENNAGQSATDFPTHARSLEILCSFYKKRWPEFRIKASPQQIIHWQNGKGVGSNKPIDWHPVSVAGGRYMWKDCERWFERWILPKYVRRRAAPEFEGIAADESIPLDELEDRVARKEMLMRDAEIELALGNLMKVAVAESVFAGFALRVDADVDRFVNSKDTLRASVSKILLELFLIYDLRFPVEHGSEKFLRELDDRLAKKLAAAYDGLKLKFAASQSEQAHQIKELSKPVLATD